jgi:tRNA (guanine-N7-)-methyltransferase
LRSRRRLPIEDLAPYLLPDVARGETPPPIDWPALFGNPNRVEIEVGFGKGLFLSTSGESRPQINFFGIEILRKFQLAAATRLADKKIHNVKLACADAQLLLRERVAAESVQAVYVFFPDPWWKQRHRKRRLVTPEFVETVGRILEPTGRLHIVTDVEEYFEMVKEVVGNTAFFQPVPPLAPIQPKHDLDYLTNFERKFRKEGRPIYRVAYAKSVGQASRPTQ